MAEARKRRRQQWEQQLQQQQGQQQAAQQAGAAGQRTAGEQRAADALPKVAFDDDAEHQWEQCSQVYLPSSVLTYDLVLTWPGFCHLAHSLPCHAHCRSPASCSSESCLFNRLPRYAQLIGRRCTTACRRPSQTRRRPGDDPQPQTSAARPVRCTLSLSVWQGLCVSRMTTVRSYCCSLFEVLQVKELRCCL